MVSDRAEVMDEFSLLFSQAISDNELQSVQVDEMFPHIEDPLALTDYDEEFLSTMEKSPGNVSLVSDSSASEPLALADYDEEFLSTMEKAPVNVSLVSDSSGSSSQNEQSC